MKAGSLFIGRISGLNRSFQGILLGGVTHMRAFGWGPLILGAVLLTAACTLFLSGWQQDAVVPGHAEMAGIELSVLRTAGPDTGWEFPLKKSCLPIPRT